MKDSLGVLATRGPTRQNQVWETEHRSSLAARGVYRLFLGREQDEARSYINVLQAENGLSPQPEEVGRRCNPQVSLRSTQSVFFEAK